VQTAQTRVEGLLCGIFDRDRCRIKSSGQPAGCSIDPLGWISACAPMGMRSPTSPLGEALLPPGEGSEFPAQLLAHQ
jgi:hypothetical protein